MAGRQSRLQKLTGAGSARRGLVVQWSPNVGLGAHREIAWLNAARTRKYRGRAISAIQSNWGARGPSPNLPNALRQHIERHGVAAAVREMSA